MEPGDIVVAKRLMHREGTNITDVWSSPNSHESNIVFNHEVPVYSHKEAYLFTVLSGGKTVRKHHPEYENFVRENLHFSKIKGMVIDFDPLGSKRSHIEGIAAVLIEDKVWWIVAGDLQVVKLGKGKQ